jgi:hypothetical protein
VDKKEMREALEAARDRLLYHNRGTTHYEGCAADHPDCAALALIERALGKEKE